MRPKFDEWVQNWSKCRPRSSDCMNGMCLTPFVCENFLSDDQIALTILSDQRFSSKDAGGACKIVDACRVEAAWPLSMTTQNRVRDWCCWDAWPIILLLGDGSGTLWSGL